MAHHEDWAELATRDQKRVDDPTCVQFVISEDGPQGVSLFTSVSSDFTIPRISAILDDCRIRGIRMVCIFDFGFTTGTQLIIEILPEGGYSTYPNKITTAVIDLHTNIITPYIRSTIQTMML